MHLKTLAFLMYATTNLNAQDSFALSKLQLKAGNNKN